MKIGLNDFNGLRVAKKLTVVFGSASEEFVLSAEVRVSEKITRRNNLLVVFLILICSVFSRLSKHLFLFLQFWFGRNLPILDLYSCILISIIKS